MTIDVLLVRSRPLQIWAKHVRNGHIKRLTDSDIQSSVLEIIGTNTSTVHIVCPADPNKVLGIKLPFLVMIIKNVCGCLAPSEYEGIVFSSLGRASERVGCCS